SGLRPSSDTIPYPVQGQLWEATATDTAIQGEVTPVVANFNARANDGQTYRVLWEVATPQGVNPTTLAEGEQTSGKIYFDVTGPAPDSVVYRGAEGSDLAVWVIQPATGEQVPAAAESQGLSAATPIEGTPGAQTAEVPQR
nr:MPT63 family protein [Actinomycetes bacterium]